MKTTQQTTTLPECLWQQAGVVPKKACYKDYECSLCRFDHAMNRVCRQNETAKKKGLSSTARSAGFVFWKDRLSKAPLSRRPCIHHMKGHIKYKNCPKSYHCIDCEFDQYFYDQYKVNAVIKPVDFDDICGVTLPAGFYLHPGHTWVKIEGNGVVRIGIDDFASRLLGKFDTIDTKMIGKPLCAGKSGVTLMRKENAVTFVSPVSGVITEINPKVRKNPGLIHTAPYTDGWIMMVYCSDLKADLKQLLFMDSSKQFMKNKVDRLYGFIEEKTQLKAADGGALVPDIYGSLTGTSWQELLDRFIIPKP